MCTNTYNEGLGGVLLQDNYVASYESIKLKYHEKNYATHDLELVAITRPKNVATLINLKEIFTYVR